MFVVRALVLLLLCASAAATDLAAQLRQQGEAWDAAIIRKDKAAVAANMTEDFRQIGNLGALSNKGSFLDVILSPRLVIEPYTVEDFEVRVYGDVALLSGRTRMKGSWDGKAFSAHYRYIDIYVRKEGGWKVASVQLTPMPE